MNRRGFVGRLAGLVAAVVAIPKAIYAVGEKPAAPKGAATLSRPGTRELAPGWVRVWWRTDGGANAKSCERPYLIRYDCHAIGAAGIWPESEAPPSCYVPRTPAASTGGR